MKKIISKIELLLIGMWFGAACFFSFVVAPSSFIILPSRELAGSIVSYTLMIINFSGVIIGAILLALSFIPRGEEKKIWVWIQRLLLLLLGIACAAGQFINGYYLPYIRSLMGRPIEEVAADDVLRIQFNTWHQYSVWILIAGMTAAFLVFFVISRTSSGNSGKGKTSAPELDFPADLKI